MSLDVGLRILVQYLHVFAGVLWIGGGVYTLFVQLPAMLATPAEARGPAMAQLGPRQIRYILRLAEVTIVTGVLNAFLTGRLADLGATLQTRWGWVVALGAALAIALYVFLQSAVKPVLFRMLAVARQAREGDAAAAGEIPALVNRFRRLGYLQVTVGALIILLMVTARYS